MKRFFGGLLRYGGGLALAGYVVWRNWSTVGDDGAPGLGELLRRPMHAWPLLAAVALFLVSLLVTFVRWYVLVRAQSLPFTLRRATRLGLVSHFFSTFLPGSVGGDVVKAALLVREQRRRSAAVATVMMDRAIGLIGLFGVVAFVGGVAWLAGSSFVANRTLQMIALTGGGIFVGSVVLWMLLGALSVSSAERLARWLQRPGRLGHTLAELWRACWLYRCRRRAMVLAVLLSALAQFGFALSFFYGTQIFIDPARAGAMPSLLQHCLLVPVGLVIQAFFPSPGGVGGSEYGFGALYALVGSPEAHGVVGALALRGIGWSVGLAGWVVYLAVRRSDRTSQPASLTLEQPVPALATGPG